MKVITIKEGQFAFGGLLIVAVAIDRIFDGKDGKELLDAGWAEEHHVRSSEAEQDEIDNAAKLKSEQETEDQKAIKDAEDEALKAAELAGQKKAEEEAEAQKKAKEAEEMAQMQAEIDKDEKAKTKTASKRKGK